MPERREAIARAPWMPAILFALAAAGCLLLSGRATIHWQPPYVALAVLLGATAAGLALRSRAARWMALFVDRAMLALMVLLLYVMVRELTHGMSGGTGLGWLFARIAWV